MRNCRITLLTKYKDGKEIKHNSVVIFAEKKSLARSEFYAAYSSGLKASYMFDILPREYSLADVEQNGVIYHATHVVYEGHEYEIIRTYEKNINSMEMTVGNG